MQQLRVASEKDVGSANARLARLGGLNGCVRRILSSRAPTDPRISPASGEPRGASCSSTRSTSGSQLRTSASSTSTTASSACSASLRPSSRSRRSGCRSHHPSEGLPASILIAGCIVSRDEWKYCENGSWNSWTTALSRTKTRPRMLTSNWHPFHLCYLRTPMQCFVRHVRACTSSFRKRLSSYRV
jgi:hypothetical protein